MTVAIDNSPFAALERLWVQAGGSPSLAPTMAAISLAESGGNPSEINDTPSTGDYSVGLWQINYYGNLMGPRTQEFGPPNSLTNPLANAKAAVALAGPDGSGLLNWSTYKSGAYQNYLPGGSKDAYSAPTTTTTTSATTSGGPAPTFVIGALDSLDHAISPQFGLGAWLPNKWVGDIRSIVVMVVSRLIIALLFLVVAAFGVLMVVRSTQIPVVGIGLFSQLKRLGQSNRRLDIQEQESQTRLMRENRLRVRQHVGVEQEV